MFGGRKNKKKESAVKDDSAKAHLLFKKYTNKEEGDDLDGQSFRIGQEGIGLLCDDISLDPEDIRVLVLLWRLGANTKPGEISMSEWETGCCKMNCYTIDDFKSYLTRLDPGFLEHSEFRSLFKFAFQFSREGTHKTLEKDIVVVLLQMTLSSRNNAHVDQFCEFLTATEGNLRITLDQWCSFLDFSVNISVDCAGYDEDDENCAWPVLIDEYVDWVKARKGNK